MLRIGLLLLSRASLTGDNMVVTVWTSWMSWFSVTLIAFAWLTLPGVDGRGRAFARFQRGDQGPDTSSGSSDIGLAGPKDSLLPAPIGGPNVCRSSGSSTCCPGWSQRGLTGLCLVPLCSRGCGNPPFFPPFSSFSSCREIFAASGLSSYSIISSPVSICSEQVLAGDASNLTSAFA